MAWDRQWKGRRGEGGKPYRVNHTFTLRMRWYQLSHGIKLILLDEEGEFAHYPDSEAEADMMWHMFKDGQISAKGQDINGQYLI